MSRVISPFLVDQPRYCNMADRVFVQVLLEEIFKNDVVVMIDDGEDYVFETPTEDKLKVLNNLSSTGEDVIHVFDRSSGEKLAWFYLIYDNGSDHDPEVCLTDHSCSTFADEVMDAVSKRMPCHPHKQEAF